MIHLGFWETLVICSVMVGVMSLIIHWSFRCLALTKGRALDRENDMCCTWTYWYHYHPGAHWQAIN